MPSQFTVTAINEVINHGYSADMILLSEALQERQLIAIADDIARRPGVKLILIAGPSSSGKTSTSKRLSIQLMCNGLHPIPLTTDNWYVARDEVPLDADGAPDFETIYALDLPLLEHDLSLLLRGETVPMPTYNFSLGAREYLGDTAHMTDDSVLVIEGLHALNPLLTEHIADDCKYKIFAAPITTIVYHDDQVIPTTVNRLLRRISRDCQTRGRTAQETIAAWASVRRGEEKWILPFKDAVDATVDTAMVYELAAIRPKAEAALQAVAPGTPEYALAQQLLTFLTAFTPIAEQQIPCTSLLREFIGNSIFNVT